MECGQASVQHHDWESGHSLVCTGGSEGVMVDECVMSDAIVSVVVHDPHLI